MNFRRRGARHDDPEVNLIPMIDVLLVIVIFLTVTTTYSRFSELQINLPKADAEKPLDRPEQINVAVDTTGRYVVNKTPVAFTTVDGLATELSIVSRCLRGVAADLGWRRAARRGRRSLPSRSAIFRGAGWAVAAMGYALLLCMHGWFATALVGLDLYGADWAPGDVEQLSRASGALLGMLVGGALLLRRQPRLGACLAAAGAIATAGLMWWLIPLLGPVAIAVTTAVTVLARRRRTTLST